MSVLKSLFLLVLPAGGQQVSRRNAWAGMSEASARSRTRREADTAFARSRRTAAVR